MVRFADDFVVLCRDPEQAKAARERAEESLREHELALHPDKTRIADMQDGFRYLGYLFVNDLALDVGGQRAGSANADGSATDSSGWLNWASGRLRRRTVSARWRRSWIVCTGKRPSVRALANRRECF